MAVSSLEELHSERSSDIDPLLMERLENDNDNEHIIDMSRMGDSSSPSTSHDRPSDVSHIVDQEGRNSSSVANPLSQPLFFSSTASNSGNSSFTRRGSGSHRRRNPLNSGLWISVELVLTLSQIVASIVVLSLSRHERPHSPLFAWIVGYASGCVAILPLLCWRYYHQNQHSEQNLLGPHQLSRQNNLHTGESTVSVAVNGTLEGENGQINRASTRNGQEVRRVHLRPKALVEYFKLALDCFFAVWFVIGNVWVFGGHSSASDAPNLYRLCIVFLVFSCIGYAMPFILCATICCCLPCIISILGFREDLVQTRGATAESINSLPTYKFKAARNRNGDDSPGAGECGFVASGTEKERAISGDDAVCCICLANYLDDEELRELPCSHLFHKECVDKWLKINASCPLCKCEVGERVPESPSGTSVGRGEGQGENG